MEGIKPTASLPSSAAIVLTFLDPPSNALVAALPRVIEELRRVTACSVFLCPSTFPETINSALPEFPRVWARTSSSAPENSTIQLLSASFFPWLRALFDALAFFELNSLHADENFRSKHVIPISLIGVFSTTDLVPDYSAEYTLGHADINGYVGVISILRLLRPCFNTALAESQLTCFTSALVKLLLHEIGHTLGLTHCLSGLNVCRMAPVSNPEDLLEPSLAALSFCSDCQILFKQRSQSATQKLSLC